MTPIELAGRRYREPNRRVEARTGRRMVAMSRMLKLKEPGDSFGSAHEEVGRGLGWVGLGSI